jgi:hypothetical protein
MEAARMESSIKSAARKQNNTENRERCKDCGKILPLRKTTKFQYCADCLPAKRKRYEVSRRIRLKEADIYFDKRRDLKKHFGITLENYNLLFENQGQKCAICHSTKSSGKGWHVDHDHKTGAIRGILCHFCNLALGHFKDDQATMKEAIKYLKGWEKTHRNS